MLLQVLRQSDPQKMTALVERIASGATATREEVRKETARPKPGRPKHYTFSYKPKNKPFALTMSFRKGSVEREEIIAALQDLLEELRQQA